MIHIENYIFFIWILPVVVQIFLPLAFLLAFGIAKVLGRIFGFRPAARKISLTSNVLNVAR